MYHLEILAVPEEYDDDDQPIASPLSTNKLSVTKYHNERLKQGRLAREPPKR